MEIDNEIDFHDRNKRIIQNIRDFILSAKKMFISERKKTEKGNKINTKDQFSDEDDEMRYVSIFLSPNVFLIK